MSAYHQMGHHSNNLIDLPAMSAFAGAIFSPINSDEEEVADQARTSRDSRGAFETILDPQLYVPASERGKLRDWSYYPKDVDSADLSSQAWWSDLNKRLADTAERVQVSGLCSPVVIPKVFDDKFYGRIVQVGSELAMFFKNSPLKILQTALVSLPELADVSRSLEIASMISATKAEKIYLVLVGTAEPRRELSQVDELVGGMRLVSALENSGTPVIVGFCSSDVLLWKSAGASSCASGKFFNLRRFTRERFEEPKSSGGQQLPYWFEEGLVAFLRQGDLLRVRKAGLLSEASSRNPFCQDVLKSLDDAAKTRTAPPSWLGVSWRQFLYWFSDVEARLSKSEANAEGILRDADTNWSKLDAAKILLEERFNDGTWIRAWLNAINDFVVP